MKDIKRYKITSANGNSSNVTKCNDGYWVRFDECEVIVSARDHVINELENRIKELESDEHINEIKAQGIEDMLEYSECLFRKTDCHTVLYSSFLVEFIKKLRTKHD